MQPKSLPSTLENIPMKIAVGDTRTRRSWGLVYVSAPLLQIEINDWFHFCSFDGEFIATGYGFTADNRGTATDAQLTEVLQRISNVAIEMYVYRAGNKIIDRFGELDKEMVES
jgi:hypothetical protein